MPTALEVAQDEARKLGIELPNDIADYILWELTPFPLVSGEPDIREAVKKALEENIGVWRREYPPPQVGKPRLERIP